MTYFTLKLLTIRQKLSHWPINKGVLSVTWIPFFFSELDGEGIGTTAYSAAFTRIHDVGDMFWWFYPTTAAARNVRPLLLWLDGATGIPPSLLANFGMIGPYDFNLNTREDSWVNHFLDSIWVITYVLTW